MFNALFLLFTLHFIPFAAAHMAVWGAWVNGVYQGDGQNVYVRQPANPTNPPITNVTLSYIACGTLNKQLPKYLEVSTGDELGIEWFWTGRGDYYISNHLGPVLVYIASAQNVNNPGIWTKLFHSGVSGADKTWPGQHFLQEPVAHHYIKVPDVPAGDYIVRAESIALHAAATGYSQHFPSCIQIRVTSNGTNTLPGGASFPGSYTMYQPGLKWNLYDPAIDQSTYPLPGPAVWDKGVGGIY